MMWMKFQVPSIHFLQMYKVIYRSMKLYIYIYIAQLYTMMTLSDIYLHFNILHL